MRSVISFLVFSFFTSLNLLALDPLPSWNEGSIKQEIIQFVQESVDENGPNYIRPEERIATFDQDGTLWVEQPLYTQFFFAIDTIKSLASMHLNWFEKEPFKSVLNGDLKAIRDFTVQEIEEIIAATHSGMSVEAYNERVKAWLAHAVHPRFKKPYTQLIYQPMLEVINYFKDNHFKVYIVSGGGQEFIRTYAETVYGIPPEQVIGTAGKVKYEYDNGHPQLIKLPLLLYLDDKAGKPEAINLIIGRRPVAAFGNSTGDQQMLEWTQGGKGPNFELLVHHDDPVREYAYDENSRIGTFSKALMEEANRQGWKVVSMKNDWKVIFP